MATFNDLVSGLTNGTVTVNPPPSQNTAGLLKEGDNWANSLTGGALDDTLKGYGGNDTLDGGTGADVMIGGTGNDYYRVDNADDVVTENPGLSEGIDTVESALSSYTLPANVEVLKFSGTTGKTGIGNGLDNTIQGTLQADVLKGLDGNDNLWGFAGDDTLEGGVGDDTLDGGYGADLMGGGTGNDYYYVNDIRDSVIEEQDGGTDSVESNLEATNLVLNAENLYLVGGAVTGRGNDADNFVRGNGNANSLDGAGGNDRIEGNNGADYLVGGEGSDTLLGGEGADTLDGGKSTAGVLGGSDDFTEDRLEGGAGDDTYLVYSKDETIVEKANEGTDSVRAKMSFTLGDNLENLVLLGVRALTGTGNALNNIITGNELANTLVGKDGADSLVGGADNDTLYGGDDQNPAKDDGAKDTLEGGLGDDTYYVSTSTDVVVEKDGEGTDIVYSSADITSLGDNVENLTLTGTAKTGTGNRLHNVIVGNDENNILDGGAGNDTMRGGKGDDTYKVDTLGDSVVEKDNEGTDTIEYSVYLGSIQKLSAGVENVVLKAYALNATGNELNNRLTGNELNNSLYGAEGNDTLDGGRGADYLDGGKGDDTYVIDNLGDNIVEAADGGNDTVETGLIQYFIGDNVENLTLTGTALYGFGNRLDNILTGNDRDNALAGGGGNDSLLGGLGSDSLSGDTGNDTLDGGEGADSLVGGAGGDDYYVDNAGDVVVEVDDRRVGNDHIRSTYDWPTYSSAMQAGEKTDRVFASISYTLTAHVEVLALTGTSDLSGTGNSLNNAITGNKGSNVLSGEAGSDQIWAGAGNDTLYGGMGDDWLDGGAGRDVLTGGSGRDAFVFGANFTNSKTGASWGFLNASSDRVMDFVHSEDQIVLSRNAFAALGAGSSLATQSFLVWNRGAYTADTRVIYDAVSGKLWYDADGSGKGFDRVLVATFADGTGKGAVLDASDFLLIS